MSQTLALAVARKFLAQEGEEELSKGGVPARWPDFLKAKYQSGKRKVPNPNPMTRDQHPEVSFSTALKDKGVFQKALKEFREWSKKNPEEDAKGKQGPSKKDKGTSEEGASKAPSMSLKRTLEDVGALVDEMVKAHGTHFDKVTKNAKKSVDDYKKALTNSEHRKWFDEMSEAEQIIHVAGHEVGAYFQSNVLNAEQLEIHEYYMKAWKKTVNSTDSTHLQGFMASAGVTGYRTANEEDNPNITKARKFGGEDEELANYARMSYAFHQAYFKHVGLKEVTLFRGVQGQGVGTDPPEVGAEISYKARELSSFTTWRKVAEDFGKESGGSGRALATKVPVERVFASSLTRPEIGSDTAPDSYSEAEMIVMGASELKAKIVSKVL